MTYWALTVGAIVAVAVANAFYFPALPLVLDHPECSARDAVRQALHWTQGHRARLLLVAAALQAPDVPLAMAYRWARSGQAGYGTLLLLATFFGLGAAVKSFAGVGAAVVYETLGAGREGELGALGRVFE